MGQIRPVEGAGAGAGAGSAAAAAAAAAAEAAQAAQAALEGALVEEEAAQAAASQALADAQAKLAQLEAEQAEVNAEIKRRAEEAARKKAAAEAEAAESGAAGASGGGGGGSVSAQGFRWPLSGYTRLSSSFGTRVHPISKVVKKHTGIDIPAPTGTPIYASKAGTVVISGVKGGYGNCVVIDHGGGYQTLYGHASKLLVKSGQGVKAGETIAKVGMTGTATGPHLHFEVRVGGTPVQPLNYVSP